jgi:hypothetical protein
MLSARCVQAIVVGALVVGCTTIASPAELTCAASAAVPPTVRGEGLTELVSDIVLSCTGGTPTASGAAVPTVNISVFFNVTVTSRALSGTSSEALLLVDEPGSGLPSAPAVQLPCQTVDGVCSIVGTGTGTGTYSGAAGRPNIFQGKVSSNQVFWTGVPVDPPGAGTRIFRMTNIRADARALTPSGGTPAQLLASISTSGSTSVPISNPVVVVGFVQPSLAFSLRNAASTDPLSGPIELPQCSRATTLRVATLRFTETFPTAFKRRNVATTFATPTTLANQNVPGTLFNTETGFFNASLVGNAARGNLGIAGLADFGTRLNAAFANVPAGITLFVDVDATSSGKDRARLTTSASGPFSAVNPSGGFPGTATIPVASGAGEAVWEITDADLVAAGGVDFGIYVSYAADPDAQLPALGTATVHGSYAPLGAATTAPAGPIPQFVDASVARDLFRVAPCLGDGAPTLIAAVLPSSRSVQVGTPATAFATVINTGATNATSCGIVPLTGIPATFSFRTTNPANLPSGPIGAPIDIPAGAAQSYVVAVTPSAPVAPTELQLGFDCTNTDPAAVNPGLNTLLLTAAATPVPDVVALATTPTSDGIVNIPGPTGTGVFAVATVNVGAPGLITVSADTGSTILPVGASICATDPATGTCLAAPADTVTLQINANATPAFGVFVGGGGVVPFDPVANRIFVRFEDGAGVIRGSTSVAVRTQ